VPRVRIDGYLRDLDAASLDHGQLRAFLKSLVTPARFDSFLESGELDVAVEVERVGRFRGNYFRSQVGLGAVFRAVPDTVIPFEDLGLPSSLLRMIQGAEGLLLVTGPTGSGKSTTLASLVEHINRNERKKILTIEDPIEVVYQSKKSFISQREVGQHSQSFASALRAAVRQDPDVIVIAELRESETMSQALTAAEMGFFVLATLHTNGAAKTVERVVDMFSQARQPVARDQLAGSLIGVISQILLPRADGNGRQAACEILVSNTAIRKLIRDGATHQIVSAMQRSAQNGCQTMDQAIVALCRDGRVDPEEARLKLRDKRLLP
jgi:twitching motility protein PilT